MARTVDDSRCAWLATVGRVDPALLSVRRARSFEKSMVLLRLLTGRRRNAQGATVIRRTFFCSLAIVAKTMDPDAAHARRLCGNDSVHSFAVAFADTGGVDGRRCCCRYYFGVPP